MDKSFLFIYIYTCSYLYLLYVYTQGVYDAACADTYRKRLIIPNNPDNPDSLKSPGELDKEDTKDKTEVSKGLYFVYWDSGRNGDMVIIESFDIAAKAISAAMPLILPYIGPREVLREGRRCVKFHTNLKGSELTVSLIYGSLRTIPLSNPNNPNNLLSNPSNPSEKHPENNPEYNPNNPNNLNSPDNPVSEWDAEANNLAHHIQSHLNNPSNIDNPNTPDNPISVYVFGRAKGQLCVPRDSRSYINECFHLADQSKVYLTQPDDVFSNPNGAMAVHTLNWLSSCVSDLRTALTNSPDNPDNPDNPNSSDSPDNLDNPDDHKSSCVADLRTNIANKPNNPSFPDNPDSLDNKTERSENNPNSPSNSSNPSNPSNPSKAGISLLELYCGNGNHTMAMSRVFDQVVSVEINGRLVKACQNNLKINSCTNVQVVRADCQKWCRKLSNPKRSPVIPYDCILIDPPRCGIDKVTTQLITRFKHVLWISCNPVTLLRDLRSIREVNPELRVCRFAFFDHFPYTAHVEVGVFLKTT